MSEMKKVFLSYSHEDKDHKGALVRHLSIMQHQCIVSAWHDNHIFPGQNWEKEIDENLHTAELILLLISSNFFASDACMEELRQALVLRHEHGVEVIPIIVRECDWKGTEVGALQALPPEGKPVTCWRDSDEAWTRVAKGIRSVIENMIPSISDKYSRFLENVEIPLAHKEVENVRLRDIFVYPYLQRLNSPKDEDDAPFSAEKLKEIHKEKNSLTLLIGDAQSGKTALCKMLYSHYCNVGCAPIWVDGKDIKTPNFSKLEKLAVAAQYQGLSHQSLKAIESHKKILILENFEKARLGPHARQSFLNTVENMYAHIIVTADDAFSLVRHDIRQVGHGVDFDLLEEFEQVRLKHFGHSQRAELIDKWVQLGQQNLVQNEKLRKTDKYTNLVDAIIGSNIAPAYPVFLLSILQTLDAASPEDHRLTAYGHCYQAMIYIALRRAHVESEDVGTYLTFATALSYHMFRNDKNFLSNNEMQEFISQHAKIFNLSMTENTLRQNFLHSRILSQDEADNWRFGYDYIHFFFVGKYLAENLSKPEVTDAISNICSKIHITRYANILIFVAHHTRDFSVLDEIMTNALCLFDGYTPASLHSSEVKHLAGLLHILPKQIIEHTNYVQEREKRLEAMDQIEEHEKSSTPDAEENAEEEDSPYDDRFVVDLNCAFKSIEVMGQILKNRHGSLESEKLIEIFDIAQSLGLKILSHFFSMFRNEDDLIRTMLWLIEHADRQNTMSIVEKKENAKQLAAWILYGVSHIILGKLSYSLGSHNLIKIADAINNRSQTPASELINLSIHAWFLKDLSFKKVKALAEKFKGNVHTLRLLRAVVINHLYMHDVSREDRQRFGNILEISEKGQLLMTEKGQGFVKGKPPK